MMRKLLFFAATVFCLGWAAMAHAQVVPTSETTPQTWRYTTTAPADGWQQTNFRDSGWQTAPAPFGHGVGAVHTQWVADDIWLRRAFTLKKKLATPTLRIAHDDDAEVYVDGTLAATAPGASGNYDIIFLSAAAQALLRPEPHVLAVHCHNVSGPQVIDVGLTDFGPLNSAAPRPVRDTCSDTWAATDGLGRALPMTAATGLPRPGKTVAVFYFLANHVPDAPIYDITKLLAADPLNPKYGPINSPHWWSQPWLGYYQSDDPAVIRTHMEMLSDAGVDVIVFDNTNGPTYPDVYLNICRVLEQMKSQGSKVPQIAFFAGHGA